VWFTHHSYKNGKLPQGVFHDTYESFVNTANYKYDEYFTPPSELFKKTVGYELDDVAKLALNKSKSRNEMYVNNEIAGTMSREKSGDAADNSFILASLYNFNVAPNEISKKSQQKAKRYAAHYFNKTMERIENDPAAVLQTAPQPVEFMVDRAADFYEDYLIQTRAANPEIVRNLYIPNFNQIRTIVRNTRTDEARRVAKKEQARLHNMLPKAIEHEIYYMEKSVPSDPQNVHDSNVNESMKEIYKRIKEKNFQDNAHQTDDDIVNEIRKAINSFPFSNDIQKRNAAHVMETMSSHNMVTALDASEKTIIADVWKRINSSDNKNRKVLLKESFMDALANGVERGGDVCTMGRCSRVLGSLTLLDTDPNVSKPVKTTEILRNEAMLKAHRTIQKVLQESPQQISEAYQDPEKLLAANADIRQKVDELENVLKNEIEIVLKNDYPTVKPETLNNLIKDAQAGV
jgi:hypothetical protein